MSSNVRVSNSFPVRTPASDVVPARSVWHNTCSHDRTKTTCSYYTQGRSPERAQWEPAALLRKGKTALWGGGGGGDGGRGREGEREKKEKIEDDKMSI